MNAFKAQQFRWTKGGAQTAMKMLPRILLARIPLKTKVEAFFQLTCFLVHVYVLVLITLLFPIMFIRLLPLEQGSAGRLVLDLLVFAFATVSCTVFYVASQYELFRDWRSVLKYMPFLMGLGVAVSLSNTKALLEAFFGKRSEFVRTPKYGAGSALYHQHRKMAESARRPRLRLLPYLELLYGVYMSVCAALSLTDARMVLAAPFLLIFAVGFFYVSILSLHAGPSRRRRPAAVVVRNSERRP
jgi:hypothetical protein